MTACGNIAKRVVNEAVVSTAASEQAGIQCGKVSTAASGQADIHWGKVSTAASGQAAFTGEGTVSDQNMNLLCVVWVPYLLFDIGQQFLAHGANSTHAACAHATAVPT